MTDRRVGTDRAVVVCATTVVLLPLIVAIITHVGRRYLPTEDFALIDLKVRYVWSRDIPLVGAYSRFGWNHPGPLMFYLVALFSGATGRHAWATLVGCAILQGVAIVLAARLAWIRGRMPLLLVVLAALALSYSALGTGLELEPWNPNVAYPFLALFALEMWSLSIGDHKRLLGGLLTGTFLVQAHIGYVPIVVAGFAYAFACVFVDARHGQRLPSDWSRVTKVAAAVFALAWIPPVLDEILRGSHGNLSRLASYYMGHDAQPPIGIRRGLGLLAAEFRLPPPWLGGARQVAPLTGEALPASLIWLLVPVALLALGAFAVSRSRSRSDGRLLALMATLLLAAAVALTRVNGTPYRYMFYWRVPLAILAVAAVGRAVATWLGLLHHRVPTLLVGAIIVALTAGSSAVTATHVAQQQPVSLTPVAATVLRQLEKTPKNGSPILMRYAGSVQLEYTLFDELDRRGVRVRADKDLGYRFGYRHTTTLHNAGTVWYFTEQGVYVSLLSGLPGATVIASASPLSSHDEQHLRALERQMAERLRRVGRPELIAAMDSPFFAYQVAHVAGIDTRAAVQIVNLSTAAGHGGACRCGVVAFSSAEAPRGENFVQGVFPS